MLDKQPYETPTYEQLADGMTVYSSDGEKLGTLRNYNPQDGFLDVRKGWLFTKDIYVPVTSIAYVEADDIVLGVEKATLEDPSFALPPANVGFGSGGQKVVQYADRKGAEQPEPLTPADSPLVNAGYAKLDSPDLADELREDPHYRIR